MANSISFVVFLLLHFSHFALGQLSIVTPPNSSVVQCANLSIEWNGGISPFFLTMGTPEDANVTEFEAVQSVENSPYIWNVDMPSGTLIMLFVRDADGTTSQTPLIAIQNSTNSSCLPGNDEPPPSNIGTDHSGGQNSAGVSPTDTANQRGAPSSTQIGVLTTSTPTGTSSSTHVVSNTATTPFNNSSSASHTPLIAGVVLAITVLLALFGVSIFILKRRNRYRRHTSSKEEFVRTFGSVKADLNSSTEDESDIEAMALPTPYIYKQGPREQTAGLSPLNTNELRRTPTILGRAPLGTATNNSPPTTGASRKGEKNLSNYASPPQDRHSEGPSRSRIEEEDIDRLAARMMAMMAAGRLADQVWTQDSRPQRRDFEPEEEDISVPPPLYNDVTSRNATPG
ncbi:hypothetical protein K439DRAFT_703771 [Ramaria rubella]|nr:hypothetical protein K439DRAFT_703771 [Ramaria rubella]